MKHCTFHVIRIELFSFFFFLVITCPKLKVPENGYLVKANACSNVVNAACGIRCRIGFQLTGDSIRLCEKDGTWSGNEPQCSRKFTTYYVNEQSFILLVKRCLINAKERVFNSKDLPSTASTATWKSSLST